MAKKKSSKKKGVKIHGIQGRVNLKGDVLKPLKKGIQSVKPDFTKKDWKSVKKPFEKAAADGKITKKELARIRSSVANTSGKSGFTYNEGQLASGYISNALSSQQYDRYIDSARGDMQSFRKNQEGIISSMMKSQREAMESQLAQIQGGANSSLNNYRNSLNQSMAQSQAMLQGQRDTFAQGNAQSMQNISQYQSQIEALPGFEQHLTDQISSSFEPVDGMDPFLNIGLRQGPIGVKRDPTITGFSSAQKASSARQQQGIQGFKTKQVA